MTGMLPPSARLVTQYVRLASSTLLRSHRLAPKPLRLFPCQPIRSSSTGSPSFFARFQRLAFTAVSKLQPPPSDGTSSQEKEPKLELSRLLEVANTERSLIGFALAAQLVSSTSFMVFPLALGNVVDAVTGTIPANLNGLVALMGGVFVVSGAATSTRVFTMSLAGSRISRLLRVSLYNAILRQETAFFDVRHSGELVNRLSNDVPLVSRTLTEHLAKIIRSGVTAATSFGLIVYLSPKLSMITLCSIPPIALFATIFGRNARHLSRNLVDALAAATQIAAERMSAIRTVRTFGAEASEARRYAQRVDDTYGLAKRVAFADGIYAGSVQLAAQMSLLGVLWFGGRMVLDPTNAMTIGALTSFSMYAVNLGVSVASIGTAYGQLTRALGAAYRVFEVLDRQPVGPSSTLSAEGPLENMDRGVRERSMGKILADGYEATVRFEDVKFAYPTRAESEVLRGVDLTVRPGEIVAVAGMSGSGKSTLGALLTRLYEPTGGTVSLGGTPLRELDCAWLRQQVAVVSQEPTLFGGTIASNVSYGLRGATQMSEIESAMERAASEEMVLGLLHGYDTSVGERGSALSGGQRARVALARALVRNPRVLVLDEHAAALDAESERAVAQAVDRAAREMQVAVVSIAHRSSSLRRADRVAVLVDGRVAEVDKYDRLMADERSYLRRMLAPVRGDEATQAAAAQMAANAQDVR